MTATVINESLKNNILTICNREGNIDKFYVFDNIPQNILPKAIKSYAKTMDLNEMIIFLYDDTVFGSAKEGFILTDKRFYCKNVAESGNFVNISEINNISFKKGVLTSTIIINVSSVEIKFNITQIQERQALFNVLNKTIELLKNNKSGSVTNITAVQTPVMRSPICEGCGARNTDYAQRCEYCDSPL